MTDEFAFAGGDCRAFGGRSMGASADSDRRRASACFAMELRAVSFAYDHVRPLVEDVSVGFEKGQVTSIVGPNGCGKSTLLRLACGIVRPQCGEALLDGRPVREYASRERARRLALLSQGPRPPAMTVESLVACGRFPYLNGRGRLSKADRDAVGRAMDLTDVARFRTCDLAHLSGGERQRAFIAMTLAQDAETVVLDEPTTYLDIGACHDVMRLVRRLNVEEDKTVVMVIHDLDLALRYSDRLVVMRDGSVLAAGEVDEVYASKAIDEAFDVEVCACSADGRRAFSVFPRNE